jgi:hypothetical protein
VSESIEMAELRMRAEKAERREKQFRTWWAGVSKQLRDLQHQYAMETWERAESCDTHGRTIKDLDAELTQAKYRHRETEADRVKLVTGLHVLQDIVRAHERGHTRDDLTVDQLIGAVGRIVARTLGGHRPGNPEQLGLFDLAGGPR